MRTYLTTIGRVACLTLLLAPATSVLAETYEIDPAHSSIVFRAGHLGIGWVVGRFNTFEGSYEYDPKGQAATQGASVVVDTTSLDSNHAERDRHLTGDEFLNVGKFGSAAFESTGYTGGADGGTLSGNLTFLGKSAPIEIDVTLSGEGDDPWGGYRSGFQGTTTLKLAEFGLNSRLVQTVDIDIYLEGIRQN